MFAWDDDLGAAASPIDERARWALTPLGLATLEDDSAEDNERPGGAVGRTI